MIIALIIDCSVIEISFGKYLEEAWMIANDNTLYFPCEVYDWLKAADITLKKKRLPRLTNFNTLQ